MVNGSRYNVLFVEPPRVMREVGKNLGIPLFVFGPETHMTAIVGMALGKRAIEQEEKRGSETTANFLLPTSVSTRCLQSIKYGESSLGKEEGTLYLS